MIEAKKETGAQIHQVNQQIQNNVEDRIERIGRNTQSKRKKSPLLSSKRRSVLERQYAM